LNGFPVPAGAIHSPAFVYLHLPGVIVAEIPRKHRL
jgi:hypothetical protein